MYNNNGIGVVKTAEDGIGFIVSTIVIGMLGVFLFNTLNSAGVQVGYIKKIAFTVYQNNTGKVAKNTIR